MLSSFRPPANASDASSTATTPCGAARAYNDWLAETYLRRDSRFKGIAILPMHDAEAALEELHHAYHRVGHVRRSVPCNRSALEPWSQTLLAGIRGSGSLGLPDRRSRRRPLGSRYGHDEYFHRRQCHRTSDVSGDRFGGDAVEQSVRPFYGPARSLSRRRSALVSHGARTSFSILRGGNADQSARRVAAIAGGTNRRRLSSARSFKPADWWWASRAGNQTWPTRSKWRASKRSCSHRTFPTR